METVRMQQGSEIWSFKTMYGIVLYYEVSSIIIFQALVFKSLQ